MHDIKKFADQLNELKRNTVVAINDALNELNKLQEEGKDRTEEVKTFSEDPAVQELIKNQVQEAVQGAVQEAVQNAVQEAIQNIAKKEDPENAGEQKTFSDAANVAQAVTELVNLPEELKNEKVQAAIDAVAEVATELMVNQLKVDTVQNAVQSLAQASEEGADEAAKAAVQNVIETIDAAIKNQPKTFSDSLEEIMKQEKENNADPKDPEGKDGEDPNKERKEFANLSPTLRYLLGVK